MAPGLSVDIIDIFVLIRLIMSILGILIYQLCGYNLNRCKCECKCMCMYVSVQKLFYMSVCGSRCAHKYSV